MVKYMADYIKKIEFVFYYEDVIREMVQEARNKIAASEVRNASRVSDPTAAAAIRNITPVEYVIINSQRLHKPERWLEVIDNTRSWCVAQGGKISSILRERYGGKKNSQVCKELDIDANYFYRALDKIRNYAALWASKFQLINF